MGGVNGSLLRRLVLVEERAPRPAPVQRHDDDVDGFWERVRAVAPAPVWAYILEVDAECQAANSSDYPTYFDDGAWLKRHHPALEDVLEGLDGAVRSSTPYLPYVQGYVVQWAYARLGWVYATERPGAGVTTSTVYDRHVQERAAVDLLGWTVAELHRQWADPCAFLEQWRSNFSDVGKNPDMLAKAGLHDAELALLEEGD
jgi:hypothetical protein